MKSRAANLVIIACCKPTHCNKHLYAYFLYARHANETEPAVTTSQRWHQARARARPFAKNTRFGIFWQKGDAQTTT